VKARAPFWIAGVAAVSLASAAHAATPPAHCSLGQLAACANTNQLVWDPAFKAALKVFFGKSRGSYLAEDMLLLDQAIDVLGGPPDAPKRLANGAWLFTACRAHDCPEKGGVVLSPTGKVLAMAMLTHHCHKAPFGQSPCERGETLDVFIDHLAGSANDPNVAALTAWGTAAGEAEYAADTSGVSGPFQGVATRGLGDEKSYAARRAERRRGPGR